MDIIIALGTAKEGFDWQWCETCLTIGVRGSLTEVIQSSDAVHATARERKPLGSLI